MAGKRKRSGETVTVTRRFSGAQAEKRAEARRAATELAAQGGYEAVTMTAVADRIGVSRATMYRYFASKDHLLSEVMQEWTERIDTDLRRRPPRGRRLADRIAEAFERILEIGARNPGTTAAFLMAATSSDPAARDAFPSWSGAVEVYLGTLLGKRRIDHFEDIVSVLGHVLFSALVAMVLRGEDAKECARVLRTAARLLLPEDGAPGPAAA